MLVELLNGALEKAIYSIPFTHESLQAQVFGDSPPSVYPVRWQRHRRIGAWRARQLVGFLDAAVGLDTDNAEIPDYQPLGLIRFLLLPQRADLIDDVAHGLLDAALQFWRGAGVGVVKAFHLSTGYPNFQIGAGFLPGDWADHVRVLTADGYRLVDRSYCLRRSLRQPVEEVTPLAGLSLVLRGQRQDRVYELFRRSDRIGSARVIAMLPDAAEPIVQISRLVNLYVDSQWRGQDIGKWLLRRLINDLTIQGCGQMVAFLDYSQHVAINLLNQQGFEELSYRGYSLEKVLKD